MSSDVFMNRIRFLGLARVFNLPPLKGKVIINVIDSLIRDRQTLKRGDEKPEEQETAKSENSDESIAKLLAGAERLCDDTVSKASTVGTQFWLATEDMADLLACGQATICYNLLRHMDQMKKDGVAGANTEQFKKTYRQALADWEKLKANPYYLMDDPYRDLKPESR
jgi:hypothetical protein